MLKKILIALIVVVAAFLVFVATRPADFKITRTATISAPPAEVFARVNDLTQWEAWSPWAKLDPAMKSTLEGPQAGVGAIYRWVGNSEVGEGSMTITESRRGELVGFKLEFLKPMASTSAAEFKFQPEGAQTVVTWSMNGRSSFMEKDLDKMVGADFEKGLAQLKALVEAVPKH
jgi:uncharacterized protein YndB with AHSA1/START domain